MPPEEGGLLDQSEIEALFGAMAKEPEKAPQPSKPAPPPPSAPSSAGQAAAPAPPAKKPSSPATPGGSLSVEGLGSFSVKPFSLSELGGQQVASSQAGDISLIADVDLNVRVELGRTRMYIEEVLRLREGSIVPLDKLAGDPVDIHVNGQLLARGEVLVLNDNFCVRISEILGDKDETTG